MERLHLKLVLIIVVAAFLLYMAWHTTESGNAGVAILNALVAVALIILAVVNRDNL